MDVQAISGPDVVPQGFSTSSETPVARVPAEEEREERAELRSEGRGAVIDTYA